MIWEIASDFLAHAGKTPKTNLLCEIALSFVLEPIPEVDSAIVDRIAERVKCRHVLRKWTIDRERGAILLALENLTREPGPEYLAYVLAIDDSLARITVRLSQEGNSSTGVSLNAEAVVYWMSPQLHSKADEVLALTKEALTAELFGVPRAIVVQLTIRVSQPNQYPNQRPDM